MAEEETPQDQTEDLTAGEIAIVVGVALAILVGLGFVVKGLYPTDLAIGDDPNFIDNVFDNRGVVLAARLLLVSAAVVLFVGGIFIIVSTFVRMFNQEWLRRAGPFEVSEEAVQELKDQIEFWRTAALTGQEGLDELKDRIEESDSTMQELLDALGEERRER